MSQREPTLQDVLGAVEGLRREFRGEIAGLRYESGIGIDLNRSFCEYAANSLLGDIPCT